jgi:hypothetical protein
MTYGPPLLVDSQKLYVQHETVSLQTWLRSILVILPPSAYEEQTGSLVSSMQRIISRIGAAKAESPALDLRGKFLEISHVSSCVPTGSIWKQTMPPPPPSQLSLCVSHTTESGGRKRPSAHISGRLLITTPLLSLTES